ncbi:biotin transporter BioY [Candidatus Hecatella orcuttiae]|jgi:biotin transport system substrate-specific component|uniref:biotin transporter BioY n=1 Tax=Candidatus Hecatella orcuttiae TaxID=1935119 RepID=UPI002867D289|nr:biotin transporter BioY [Candidatus Hecatella orcuttiae]
MRMKPFEITLAALFAALTAIGAYISIPLYLVPITLQTFFVYLAGAVLGGRLAALSQLVYIGLGGVGFPVFAGGMAGFGVLLGPTGGYLAGFVLGAYVIGKLTELKGERRFVYVFLSMLLGTAIIYSLGAVQLSFYLDFSLKRAVAVGVLPFLPGDALKMALAAYVASTRHMRSLALKIKAASRKKNL